ncbi:hypothetical protein EMIT036CA2_80044 [Chryseobacterium sp. IT-36CA2]
MGTDAQKAFHAPFPTVWIDLIHENISLKSLSVIERDFFMDDYPCRGSKP